jgi:hypothetical protein
MTLPAAMFPLDTFRDVDTRQMLRALAIIRASSDRRGKCTKGLRRLAREGGIPFSTMQWAIARLTEDGHLDEPQRTASGRRKPCDIRIAARNLWVTPSKIDDGAAPTESNALDKGKATSKPPHFDRSESCSPRPREENPLNQWVDAEGCADAPPDGIEAVAEPETPERPSDAPPDGIEASASSAPAERPSGAQVHPRAAAARFVPITTGRKRPRQPPQGAGLAAQKRARFDQINVAFLEAEGDGEARAAYQRAIVGSDDDAARRMRDRVRYRRHAAHWKPPPGLLPPFDPFNTRGPPRPSPEERRLIRERQESKHFRFLKAAGRPGEAVTYLRMMTEAEPSTRQAYFDAIDARMRALGWNDIPPDWYEQSGLPVPGRKAPPPELLHREAISSPADDGRDRAAADAIMLRAGWYHGKTAPPPRAERISLAEILARAMRPRR